MKFGISFELQLPRRRRSAPAGSAASQTNCSICTPGPSRSSNYLLSSTRDGSAVQQFGNQLPTSVVICLMVGLQTTGALSAGH
jgi:hypothetical protein